MPQSPPLARQPAATYAVSNTGPLISAFQSQSLPLLMKFLASIHVPRACAAELEEHGWAEEMDAAAVDLVIVNLTTREAKRAESIAMQIAQRVERDETVAEHHKGEAEAIVLALRPEYARDLILLDELAARQVAKDAGLRVAGFPGALLLAAELGLISADELKAKLETCRKKGTHYGATLVEQVYSIARQAGRGK